MGLLCAGEVILGHLSHAVSALPLEGLEFEVRHAGVPCAQRPTLVSRASGAVPGPQSLLGETGKDPGEAVGAEVSPASKSSTRDEAPQFSWARECGPVLGGASPGQPWFPCNPDTGHIDSFQKTFSREGFN